MILTNFAKGVPPAGLRFDSLHLNPTGSGYPTI